MKKLFPDMYSKPETVRIIAIIPCWLWVFVLLPMFMPFLGLGLWDDPQYGPWLEIGYHVANSILMLMVIGSYLKDEWFMIGTKPGYYLKHSLLTVGLMLVVELVWLTTLSLCGVDILDMLQGFPVVEFFVNYTPLSLLIESQVFGTIVMVLLTPISICALFYCLGFAPVCEKKPWLAYLCIAVITLIPPAVDILWRGGASLILSTYLARLPIHLLACWVYQKTDNVWTPLVSLVLFNLLTSGILLLLFANPGR